MLNSGIKGWAGAEAVRHGKPLVIRLRRFSQIPLGDSFPYLFSIVFKYDICDESALPTTNQYEIIKIFEDDVLDFLERSGNLIITLIETGNGAVQYYLYTWDVDETAAQIDRLADDNLPLEFSADEDHEWTEYKKRLSWIT